MRTHPRRSDERGQSMSLLVVLAVPAMILAAGLAVDGAQQAQQERRAETSAAVAARAGADAAATELLAGRSGVVAGRRAAELSLSRDGVAGTAQVVGDRVVVRTSTSAPTLFLSLIRITEVRGEGFAESSLRD